MNVFNFYDYRNYLNKYILSLPRRGHGERLKIVQYLKVSSALLSQILAGHKHFTLEQANSITQYLGLNMIESDYFMMLVHRDRAGTKELRIYYEKRIEQLKEEALQVSKQISQDYKINDFQKAIFYSSWLYQGIRLFCSMDKGRTVEDICVRFGLERDQALDVLKFLAETQLCRQEGPYYQMGPQRTHLEFGSPFLVRHHNNWRLKALQKADQITKHELMFTGPMSISRKDFQWLRGELVQLIQKLSEKITTSEAEEIACLNMDLFWVQK